LSQSLSFDASDFNITNTASTAFITLDWTNGPASRSADQTITGFWQFSNSVSVSSNFEISGYASIGGNFDLAADGIRLSAADGAITFLSRGDGSGGLEDFTINIDDTSNTGVWSSSTGLNKMDFGAIGIELDQDVNITLGAQTIDHDGTDFVFSDSISTTGISSSGLTMTGNIVMSDNSITGIDTLTFTDTAGTIAGIANANLVDKSASEAITGALWTFGNASGEGIEIGSTGVRLTSDQDGALTFLSISAGSQENFVINLDDTSNTGVWSSSTGLNKMDFGAIGIELDQDVNIPLGAQTIDHDGTDFVFSDNVTATAFGGITQANLVAK